MMVKLKQTLKESVWDNGQVMLVDIARREELTLGPTRRMQELMVRRNSEILRTVEKVGNSGDASSQIAAINDKYGVLITAAARSGENPGRPFPSNEKGETIMIEGDRTESEKLIFAAIIG